MRLFDIGTREGREQVVYDRVLTVANGITFVRLLGLPLFVWLMVVPRAWGLAFAVLVAVSTTDWVDGYVARRFDQVTRLGKVMDPLIDRALLATVGITLAVVGDPPILPWPVVAAVVARDVGLLGGAALLERGARSIPVSKTGKLATACLMIGIPGFLVARMDWVGAPLFGPVAWAFTGVGVAAYYAAGAGYARRALGHRAAARG